MAVRPAAVALLLVLASAAAFAGMSKTLWNIRGNAAASAAAAIKRSTHHQLHPVAGTSTTTQTDQAASASTGQERPAINSSSSSSISSRAQNTTQPEQAVNATGSAAADAEDLFGDLAQRPTWDAEPTYASHYRREADRPNICRVAHRQPARVGSENYTFAAGTYVPYIATSVVRDSQLLLTRLYYSIDYPVKWFVVVASEEAASGKNAIAYQLKHMQDYPQDKVGLVIISCEHFPAVTESWNAVFQTFRDEPWGVYIARDCFWERGSLANLSGHGWQAAKTGEVELGFIHWTNMGLRDAIHNIFMLTAAAVRRFGLFDENIYPAFCEDLDMIQRGRVMDPPMRETQFMDVHAVHGKRADTAYYSGTGVPDDPNLEEEKTITGFTAHRVNGNCNYFRRKWGCPSGVYGDWMHKFLAGECRFKTPFHKAVPHWYWHTTKALRARDQWLTVSYLEVEAGAGQKRKAHFLADAKTQERIFEVPQHYGEWGGYFDNSTRVCRVSGVLGRTTARDGRTVCL